MRLSAALRSKDRKEIREREVTTDDDLPGLRVHTFREHGTRHDAGVELSIFPARICTVRELTQKIPIVPTACHSRRQDTKIDAADVRLHASVHHV